MCSHNTNTNTADQRTIKGKPNMLSRPSTPISGRAASPVRKSPFLQPKKSPLLVAANAKVPPIPLRTRLIQLLASGAANDVELSSRLRIQSGSLSDLLEDVAVQKGQDWALRDTLYQEVKFWDWKGYTTSERSCAISRASEAMDRLQLPANHTARLRLVHPEKRNAEERSDTSPLSLNTPINADTQSEASMPTSLAPPSTLTEEESINAPKKVTARGILSQGKSTVTKKSLVTPKSEAASIKDQAGSVDADTQKGVSTKTLGAAKKSATEVDKANKVAISTKRSAEEKGLAVKKARSSTTNTDNSRLQASIPIPDKSLQGTEKRITVEKTDTSRCQQNNQALAAKQPSKAREKSIEPVKRSQTPTAIAAQVAPSTGSLESLAEELHKRTASITSSTTDRSERSVMSSSSASTAPSVSATSPPPQKLRSKFLTTKQKTSQTPRSAASTPRASPAPPVRIDSKLLTPVSIRETPHGSPTPIVCKKRKAETPMVSSPPAKRIQTIDLQDMAKSYKQLYPEYKVLHDLVITKLGDQDLFSKFMKMHNQMSSWKQTLKKAPNVAESS